MTKIRKPGTIENAVTRVVGLITWDAAAEIVGKDVKVVRNWTDEDTGRCPRLDEAIALDAAYVAKGGGDPPLLAAYMLLLDAAKGPSPDREALVRAVVDAVRESGEANAAAVAAMQPGASGAVLANALRELEESQDAGSRLLKQLKRGLVAIDGGKA